MRRVIGIVAASLAALAVVGAALLYWFLSGDGVRTAIERQASAWLGQPVTIASARVSIWPRAAIGLRDVAVGNPARLNLAEVDVAASPLALLSRRVEDAELRIRNTRLELPLQVPLPQPAEAGPGGASPGPPSDASTAATTESDGGFRVVSVSSVVLDNVMVSSRGRELTVSSQAALVGSRLLVRELVANSGRTAVRATGTVALQPSVDADLAVEANRLDMDELLALGAAFLPPASQSRSSTASGPPPRLKATVRASTAHAAGIDAKAFTATMSVEGERASFSPLAFELFGGRYEGAIQARLGKEMSASVRAQLAGVDMAQVAVFGNSPDTISGTLSGNATVTGSGQDLSAVLASARGNGNIVIADGTMQRLGLVRTIVLFFGRPEANGPPSTDRFDRLEARFGLAGGNLRAESFALRSSDLDGTGSGALNLNTRALSGRMNVTLSEALSRQAGTDLRRYTREGNRIVLPVTLGGTLNQPSVNIDAAAALQRGLRNEVERRLKGVFERFK
jgi:uncharacterized protein involved in outer membrane biogenesis